MSLTSLVGDNVLTGTVTATSNSAPILLGNGGGSFVWGHHTTAVAGAGSLALKIQESDDASSWADLAGAGTLTASAAGSAVQFAHSAKKFVRVVGTLTGTSVTLTVAVAGFGQI